MILHQFTARGTNFASACGAVIGTVDGSLAVLLVELEDNPGRSVTNSIEQIADELLARDRRLQGRQRKDVLWFETYEVGAVPAAAWRYDRVTFLDDGAPVWRRLDVPPAIEAEL